jgi:hypothetical protein
MQANPNCSAPAFVRADSSSCRRCVSRSACAIANARRRRAEARHATPHRVQVADAPMVAHALDIAAGIWILRATHQGDVVLQLNGDVASMLDPRTGLALMNMEACPFERAAEVVAAVRIGLTTAMSRMARTDLEFDLARWLPLYFDL